MNVEVKKLDYSFSGKFVLKDINFKLNKNECLVIQGHNGGGKTTLINCLVKENKIPSGKVFYDNIDINKFDNWTKIGYVPQFITYAKFPVSVIEFLMSYELKNNKQRVLNLLNEFELIDCKNKNLHSLSGGQKRRIFIIRALLNEPELLIFDEPLVAIDKENRSKIVEILKKLKLIGISMIIITHNFHEFHGLADKIIELNNEIEFCGTESEYIKCFGACTHGIN